jgi:hypothetical protein
MEDRENKIQEYYEILVNNHEKGETYTIKFRDNPVIYKGIPMIPRVQDDENIFKFKIVSPPKYKGIKEMSINEIEKLEKEPYGP